MFSSRTFLFHPPMNTSIVSSRLVSFAILFALGTGFFVVASLPGDSSETSDGEETTDSVTYGQSDHITGSIEEEARTLREEGNVMGPEEASNLLQEATGETVSFEPPAPRMETRPSPDIYRDIKKSTAVVGTTYECSNCGNLHTNAASGYIIGKEGLAVTNYHVVESYAESPDQNKAFLFRTGEGQVYAPTDIIAASQENDLAILQLDTGDDQQLTPLPLGEPAEVGTKVYVLSHPRDQFYYFSDGMVSRNFRHVHDDHNHIRMSITADYARGSSGGPVVDSRGNLVGTVRSTRSIYYNEQNNENLQMVVKNTIPVAALHNMIETP